MELLQPLWNAAQWKESRHMEDSFRTFIPHSQTAHFSKLKRSDYVFVFFGIFTIFLVTDGLYNFLLFQFYNKKGVAWKWDGHSQIWISVHEGNDHMADSFEGQVVCIVFILSFFLPSWLPIIRANRFCGGLPWFSLVCVLFSLKLIKIAIPTEFDNSGRTIVLPMRFLKNQIMIFFLGVVIARDTYFWKRLRQRGFSSNQMNGNLK